MAMKIKTQTVCKVMQVRANCIQGVYISKSDLERYNSDSVTMEDGRVAYFQPSSGWSVNHRGSEVVGYEITGHLNIVEAEEEWLAVEPLPGFDNISLERDGFGEATMSQPRGKGLGRSRRLLCRTQHDYDRVVSHMAQAHREVA